MVMLCLNVPLIYLNGEFLSFFYYYYFIFKLIFLSPELASIIDTFILCVLQDKYTLMVPMKCGNYGHVL